MSAQDPYAEFGGSGNGGGNAGGSPTPTAPTDPYAEFGGSAAGRGGATGSWTPPPTMSPAETGLRFVLNPIARFGKGAVDAATGTVSGLYHAFVNPAATDEEKLAAQTGGVLGLAAHRILYQPQAQEAKKAAEAKTPSESIGHSIAAGLPLVGPYASNLAEKATSGQLPEALGEAAFGYLTGRAFEELPGIKLPEWKRGVNEQQISAMGDLINSGVKNKSSYNAAEVAIPLWQQAASELGTTLDQSLKEAFPTRGLTETGKHAVRTAGEEVVGGPASPVGIANHAVDIAERPFKDVLNAHGDASTNRAQFGNIKAPQVKQNITNSLESAAKIEDGVNDALAKAIRALKERVESNGDTFNVLNELKVLANKKSAAIFDKNLSGQINATAETAYAWKVLGDSIRSEMYPELSRLSGVDLRAAGMREAVAMDARDGVMNKYFKEVEPAQQARMKMNYFEYLRRGSLFRNNLINKALGLTPAGEFNLTVRRALGNVPPTPSSVPYYPAPNRALPPTVAGVQHDLIPHDVNAPLLEPPPGTSHSIAEDIFRVQQNADRAARIAPPPTIAGRQTSIAENALPDSPFYPGKSGVHTETVIGPDGKPTPVVRDYSNQAQLFSLNPTPYRWNPTMRLTSTMQDLTSLAAEIDHYLKTQNPPPHIRRAWESDLADVKHEIFRRQEAHRTPSKKNQ